MPIAEDQIAELKEIFPGVSQSEEGGCLYYLLPNVELPEGCTPAKVDCLFCPNGRDGYSSRLYFAQPVQSRAARTFNSQVRILDRNWVAFSWNIKATGLRLAQTVAYHLSALK
ncbi:MAG: hypothetical protein KGO96_08495 [Elusimicrobia bacterium]|nr:hypothetical protein [Elusimicrobiota bacterium]MDE2425928.1 hypothetical protein [Elusimicrobiota bacterium]